MVDKLRVMFYDIFYLFWGIIAPSKIFLRSFIKMDPDPNPTSIIWKLVLLLVLILVNAFFAMSEIAIITLNDNKRT